MDGYKGQDCLIRFNRYMVECELEFEIKGQKAIHSFNRYMVECEYFILSAERDFLFVLIDTWWNVNMPVNAITDNRYRVLIDTWWNVNVRSGAVHYRIPAF